MRGCGRIARPAFPAPSDVSDGTMNSKTRVLMRGENRGGVSQILRW